MSRVMCLAALAVALGACFSPTYNNPQCGPAGECPLGFTCELGVCLQDDLPIDARSDGPTDAPDLDAETDGPDEEIDAPPGPMCPTGSTASPDDPTRCFFITGAASNWDTVRNDCLAVGGDLADVLSQPENDLIFGLTGQQVWLGGTDEPLESNWVWISSGTTLDSGFTAWAPGEPSSIFGTQNCLMMEPGGQWSDESCADNYPGACRVPAI